MRFFISSLILLCSFTAFSQVSGHVYEENNGVKSPIVGAAVFWEGSQVTALTNKDGYFEIAKPKGHNLLVVQLIGFKISKKSIISSKGTVDFILTENSEMLEGLNLEGRAKATSVEVNSAQLSLKIGKNELRKAACCNLSESFETNASLDVTFSDAVSGAKQIEMLGQSGKYVSIQRENIPLARGINAQSGLTYIPGPFVNSIQLTKGLSSVINGYESLTGQINIELEKPGDETEFFINGYGNQGSRLETNLGLSTPVNKNLGTTTLAHFSTTPFARDGNDDGFADIPTGYQANVFHKWKYILKKGWGGQIGFNYVNDERKGGQLQDVFDGNSTPWIFNQKTQRTEVFGKTGYAPPNKMSESLGIIYSASYQKQETQLGPRVLKADQKSAYVNVIYQNKLWSPSHKIKTGASFQFDEINESLDSTSGPQIFRFNRTEAVPGVFAEYSYEPSIMLTVVGGVRVDYHNLFGWMFTPRAHVKYMPTETTTFRIGGGRGQRTANVLTENATGLASGRSFQVLSQDAIDREIGWNTGLSFSQSFSIGKSNGNITSDVFYTWFENKLISNFDASADNLLTYYASGSNSFSWLTQLDYSPVKDLEIRIAYKYLKAEEAFGEGQNSLAYAIPKHRGFLNVGYAFPLKITADATLNWFDSRRLPGNSSLPTPFGEPVMSPSYFTLNGQVNKQWGDHWEVYVGVENALNYKVDQPITSSSNPYLASFDTNQVYGPIFGRMFYLGFNYHL